MKLPYAPADVAPRDRAEDAVVLHMLEEQDAFIFTLHHRRRHADGKQRAEHCRFARRRRTGLGDDGSAIGPAHEQHL